MTTKINIIHWFEIPVKDLCRATSLFLLLALYSCATTSSLKDVESLRVDGEPTKYENTFSMGYRVSINIKAPPQKIWKALTSAESYPDWNSTVISLKGNIVQDGDIVLRSKVAPERDFELNVSEFILNNKMVWEDGTSGIFKGVRTYILEQREDGSTDFFMVENFAGAMLPMIKGSLPDFTESFRDFASDLKKKSEK